MRSDVLRMCLLLGLTTADGFLLYGTELCVFDSSDVQDIEYIYSLYYDRVEFLRFSSTLGWYSGYTGYGLRRAASANNNTARLSWRRDLKWSYCLPRVKMWTQNALNATVAPEAVLTSTLPPGGSQRIFTCSAFNFFPRNISISWTINEEPPSSEVSSSDTFPNGDWLYQAHSQLSYAPRFGDTVSCWVEHAALKDALEVPWEPLSHGDRNKMAVGISGSVLGLVLGLSGVLYNCKTRPDCSRDSGL